MKRIITILTVMTVVLSSCSQSRIEPVSKNESANIILNISVDNPGVGTRALIKSGWEVNDEIFIWYDDNKDSNPNLVIIYDGSKWMEKKDATVSEGFPIPGEGRYAKALYNGTVKVASKDIYDFDGNILTLNIANWVFLTEIQVVVSGLSNAANCTLACEKFTPLASGTDCYTIGDEYITAKSGTKGAAVTGMSNEEGTAFVFATADYSESSTDKQDFTFTLSDNTGIKEYTANVAIEAKSGKSLINALIIDNSKFKAPSEYVGIWADYDNDSGTPNTILKWSRQNLAITASGKRSWEKSGISSGIAVKVPGTDKEVQVGDYFQWAAYKGYCGEPSGTDKGLVIYTAFDHGHCVGDSNPDDHITFKKSNGSNTYWFHNKHWSGNSKNGISPYCNISGDNQAGTYGKYNSDDGKSVLERASVNDDVANIILGGNWRMPTKDEFNALINATFWAWDGDDHGYYVFTPSGSHLKGAKANSVPNDLNKNDALLFFPAAGYADSSINSNFINVTASGSYWSSTIRSDYTGYSYYLSFATGGLNVPNNNRHRGYSVRPVSD